jgi:hypothetical protein
MIDANAVRDLLAELAANTPALPRAACRGHTELFDSEDEHDITEAIALCKYLCPELLRCATWAAGVDPKKLTGVIAGRNRTIESKRRHHGTPAR